MTREELNAFCGQLPHTTHVVQWGGADVWKVGGTRGEEGALRPTGKVQRGEEGALRPTGKGKVFVVGGWNKKVSEGEDIHYAASFKTSEIGFEMLRDAPGCRPAPYLASRGMKWIQRINDESMSDEDLLSYIKDSHRIVSLGLTKKLQKELGLNQDAKS